jgi:hypothetical protein
MTSIPIYPEYPCITEVAIVRFKSTWLMVKRHKTTGLMYFCKTTVENPITYLGSGKYWWRHLRKHGTEHVETIWHQLFDDIYLLVEFALGFSKDADIVASKEWANLVPENGLDGGNRIVWTEERLTRQSKMASEMPRTETHCRNIGKAHFGKKHTQEANKNVSRGLSAYFQTVKENNRVMRENERTIYEQSVLTLCETRQGLYDELVRRKVIANNALTRNCQCMVNADLVLKEILVRHTAYLPADVLTSERLFHILHDLHARPICEVCGIETIPFFKLQYRKNCSRKCRHLRRTRLFGEPVGVVAAKK